MWHFSGIQFAKKHPHLLPVVQFNHRTPLLRSLKNADMTLQYHKITNLRIAVGRIDRVVLYPGETFSFWKLVGRPTRSKGYLEGMILYCGQIHSGIGGGLCQLSNLIYWMTLHTPLTIIERYRHSFDVFPDSNRTQPFGSGATCVYNYRDLMIRNETGQPFQLCVCIHGKYLTGEWRSLTEPRYNYRVYEKDHHIVPEYWGGYTRHNALWREIFGEEGRKIEDQFITENHAVMMYDPLLDRPQSMDIDPQQ